MTPPEAVLLDAGGVLVLPERDRILGAFDRAGWRPSPAALGPAHYRAAHGFGVEADAEGDWVACWERYLRDYVVACGAPESERDEIHTHLDSEFADAALWCEPVPGVVDDLRALAATGVRLGVVSNADGVMGERLRALEILQVGPGIGVDVACVIDSGAVGVMKPDARIFRLALDVLDLAPEQVWFVGDMPAIDVVGARRAGLRPVLLDPLELHHGGGYDRVGSLAELAERVATARSRFDLAGARAAAVAGTLPLWVGRLLASRGSDNVVLAAGLAQRPHWWLGPILVPLSSITRLAGPEPDAVCPIEPRAWEHDVLAMEHSMDDGWEPPPLLAECRDGRLLLHDGNHRYEALVREGETEAWVVVWFDDPTARDRFATDLGLEV